MAEAEEPEGGSDSEITRLRNELAAAEGAAAEWAAERRLPEESESSHQGPQNPTNQRTPEQQRGCLIGILLLIGAVVALAIAAPSEEETRGSQSVGKASAVTTKAPAATTTQARTGASSCSIQNEARDLVREWNRVSAELVAILFDSSTTQDQYLGVSRRVLPKLQRIVAGLRSLKVCLPGAEWKLLEPFVDTYNDKFSGYSAMEVAVRIGSTPAMDDAYNILVDANDRSVAIVCEIARAVGQRLPGAEVC